ncbi:MAG: sucrose phosphorylase [Lacrimispora sp.]|nr:sucrose phosphorylase [Lacrimispora sp.]
MELNNKIMLITYADSLGKNLKELDTVLHTYLHNEVGGVHILPFFPSSADRGFAPLCYDQVDAEFGTFEDIKRISKDYYLMFDFMVNHISRNSDYFKDFEGKKDLSAYRDMFIRYKDFWDQGEPTEEEVDLIYKRKPRAPYSEVQFKNGDVEKVWCTFCEEQIDLDVRTETTKEFIRKSLTGMCENGASIIRLDAFAYAVKKKNTNCFFVEPDIWELLHEIQDVVSSKGVDILPEIHEHYTIQMKIAKQGFWIYDFALPVLVLNALYSGNGIYLKRWLEMCPKKQFTTLDTHDGIGIVDARDLMPDEAIEETKEKMYTKGANVKKIYNTAAYNNLDIYQVNTTYYSALGDRDDAYLLARAIQFFAPGIPQVYYVGLLAGTNDIELMEKTKNGRDINRHYYSLDEIEKEVNRPVVKQLFELMRFRNTHPAFALEGNMEVKLKKEHELTIIRTWGTYYAALTADLKTFKFDIIHN